MAMVHSHVKSLKNHGILKQWTNYSIADVKFCALTFAD
jgi:hypothetical protein